MPSHYLNQWWVLSIGPLGTKLCEILIKISNISLTKLHLKISSVKLRPFLPLGDELIMESNSCILYFIKCSKSLDSSQPLPLYVSSLLTLCILQGQLMMWYDLQTTIPAALNSPLIYMDTFVVNINNKNLNQLCYNSQNMLRWFFVCSSHMLSVVGIYIPLAGPQAACPAYRPRHYILLDLVDTQASANTVIFLCFDYTDCCFAMCPFESSEVVSHASSFNLQLLVFCLHCITAKTCKFQVFTL